MLEGPCLAGHDVLSPYLGSSLAPAFFLGKIFSEFVCGIMNFSGLFTGHDLAQPAGRAGPGGPRNLTGWVGSGRVRRSSKCHVSGEIGSPCPDPTRPDPTREFLDPTREQSWKGLGTRRVEVNWCRVLLCAVSDNRANCRYRRR